MKPTLTATFLLVLAACTTATPVASTTPPQVVPSTTASSVTPTETTTATRPLPTTTTIVDVVAEPLGGYLGADRSGILVGFQVSEAGEHIVYTADGEMVRPDFFEAFAGPTERHRELGEELPSVVSNAETAQETCEIDGIEVGGTWVLCRSTERDSNPVIKFVSDEGEARVVGSVPEAPAEFPGAFRVGHWREVFVRADGAVLGQYSAECEMPLALMVRDGAATYPNGAPYWSDPQYGQSNALGWTADGRALVWRSNGLCSAGVVEAGVYAYGDDGTEELVFATGGEVLGIRSDRMTRDIAIVYPFASKVSIEEALASDQVVLDTVDLEIDYLTWVLGWTEAEAYDGLDATDSWGTFLRAAEGEIYVGGAIAGWRLDGSYVAGLTDATTFWENDDFYLSVNILESTPGEWLATVQAPEPTVLGFSEGVTVTVRLQYASASYERDMEAGTVSVAIGEEPQIWGILEVAYRDADGQVVGWHSITIPAGEFVAG